MASETFTRTIRRRGPNKSYAILEVAVDGDRMAGATDPTVYLREPGMHSNAMSPSEARDLAMALIAAADFSEGL